MGINLCTKITLLFEPLSLGTLGLTNTWIDQGTAQIQLLLGHLRQDAYIGELMQIVMENL